MYTGILMENTKLPKESDSQEIGHRAVITLNSCHPISWRTTPTEGDADVGLDMQVQIVDLGHYTNVFNAQIKGSAQNENGQNKKLNAAGDHFSLSLNISTLNYYARIEYPVMLIFVDLSKNPDPRKCPAYYLWIDEEIDRLRQGQPNLDHLGKGSLTFHIPIENVINPDLNVLPYLNSRLEKKRVLEGLYATVEEKYPDVEDKITQISTVFKTNNIAIETVLNKTETPWLDAPKGSFAYQLKKVSEALSLNNAAIGQDLLKNLTNRIEEASNHEKSEYYYQMAYLCDLIGNRNEAQAYYEEAHLVSKEINKYHVAYLESRIPYENICAEAIKKIITEIPTVDDIDYLRLKSKLMALIGFYKEAFDILNNKNENDVFVVKAIIYLLSGSYNECISYINEALLEQEPNFRQKLSLKALKARAYFNLGFSKIPENKTIPFLGTPDMNPGILKEAWIELISAWDLASQLGYPRDVETMVDMFTILGMYFGETDIVKKHLIKLAEIRPFLMDVQEVLLSVAMHSDDRVIAAQQLSILPITIDNTVMKILLASRIDEKSEVVRLTSETLGELLQKKPSNYDNAVAVAAECANDLMMYDERDKFLSALQDIPDSRALIAVYEFITQMNREPLEKPQALEKLYAVYKEGYKHFQILTQLYHNLDSHNPDSAQKIIEISKDIKVNRDLSDNEYKILCEAKATTQDWKEVLLTSRMAQVRFSNPRFKAYEALALDEIGETGESIELLEAISTGEKFDPLALQVYINIAARCGLIGKAKALVTRLLEKTSSKKQKLRLWRMIFSIEMYIDPKAEGLVNICLKYGQLCDQNDEVEEGVYLLNFLAATFDPKIVVQEKDVKEFQARLLKYKDQFPESKILRSFSIDNEAPEGLLAQLSKITGFTEEKRKWYQRNENYLKYSRFPIPYLIRPRLLLNVSDFLHLWELSKIAGVDYPQYFLTISAGQYQMRSMENIGSRMPLIDEMALLVLFDLGLLEYIFTIFSKVAIVKDTIVNLQNVAQQFGFKPYEAKAKDIITLLSKYVERIQQPSSKEAGEEESLFNELDHVKSVYNPSIHIFYTDDAILRVYVCGDDHFKDTISTIDIIAILRDKNVISAKIAAEKYAKLCYFHVIGTPISYKDILIVLKDDLPSGEGIDRILERLNIHQNFNSFINDIWWFKGDYAKALIEIGQFLAYMISGEDGVIVEKNIISAIWYYWYKKVQFTIKADKDRLHFLARSFLSTCIQLKYRIGDDAIKSIVWSQAWSIYNSMVEFVYGDEMSREIENRSISLLAQMISDVELESNNKIFNDIALGLASDTAERVLFQDAYIDNNIRMRRKKGSK